MCCGTVFNSSNVEEELEIELDEIDELVEGSHPTSNNAVKVVAAINVLSFILFPCNSSFVRAFDKPILHDEVQH